MPHLPDLPVSTVLGELAAALDSSGRAVLVAPPGAGKTTLVPLHLLDGLAPGGRILLLEPRRLAARAAARRMAAILGEEVGETVGYAMRMDSRAGPRTRILVITEGLLARMILDDPELSDIGAIIFDEFHERSLDGDFGLALALDIAGALRPDLKLLVMSATLDGARIAGLLGGAPTVESAGRSFPVDIRYLERAPHKPAEDAAVDAVVAALAGETGSILVFLPGQREIDRTARRLEGRVGASVDVVALHGGLDARAQDAAIRPAPEGRRKVVLATTIAETSLTIEGVRIVIDAGLSRVPRYEPATGLTRLVTVRAARASVDQRAGRAGRTEPGIAIRLWRAEQTAALPAFATPEIMEADLSGLVLDCAAFGVADPSTLAFPDPPPRPALEEARALLQSLDALDEAGRITPEGEAMRALALPPRLAHMVHSAAASGQAEDAARLAVLLTERGLGGSTVDLEERLRSFGSDRSRRAADARALAGRLARQAGQHTTASDEPRSIGGLLAAAYPDRIAMARGELGRFVLANGRGGVIDAAERLSAERFLVVAEINGPAQNARIGAATAIEERELRALAAGRIVKERVTRFDAATRSLKAAETERLGAIRLGERPLPAPSGPAADAAMIAAVKTHGLSILPFDRQTGTLRQRLSWLHHHLGAPWPAMDDDALTEDLETWLMPFLGDRASLAGLAPAALRDALFSRVPYELHGRLDEFAPTHFDAPSGSRLPIRYEEDGPVLAIRVQELFGLDRHPAIAGGKIALLLELLSPAHRTIQTTRDLPGFWRGSWAEVRAEMRGRYPKHHWPDDPLGAEATSRAKPRAR